MSSGLRVKDTSGNTIVDSSTSMGRILGNYSVTTPGTYTVTNTGFSTGTPFYVLYNTSGLGSMPTIAATVTFSGNTMTIVQPTEGPSSIIFYGVY